MSGAPCLFDPSLSEVQMLRLGVLKFWHFVGQLWDDQAEAEAEIEAGPYYDDEAHSWVEAGPSMMKKLEEKQEETFLTTSFSLSTNSPVRF